MTHASIAEIAETPYTIARKELTTASERNILARERFRAKLEAWRSGVEATQALIVDDAPGVARIIAKVVKSTTGLDAHLAESAAEAIRLLRERSYSLVVVDLNLGPGMTGAELVTELRRESKRPLVPVIMTSGYVRMPELAEVAALAGANVFLQKPWDSGDLAEACRKLVDVDGEG